MKVFVSQTNFDKECTTNYKEGDNEKILQTKQESSHTTSSPTI